ncbi:hypothetical protein EVAR_93946_1 [Eumeta japonica]|uniref:Uncharacterized protein n=1 Tax=Eumeta variegata TaxID=151549 RepID=A0A4C1TP79_EUMVA|nr:hypothetical protein EVAR_93946_1 [Eumeta japonica]
MISRTGVLCGHFVSASTSPRSIPDAGDRFRPESESGRISRNGPTENGPPGAPRADYANIPQYVKLISPDRASRDMYSITGDIPPRERETASDEGRRRSNKNRSEGNRVLAYAPRGGARFDVFS